ncbi:MAG: aminotransferase DegT [Candidatus Tectimicrobiota bacterium]|nr:MAG: aminotransferase DegT [Candidatus Tectomicrobia bacterium]
MRVPFSYLSRQFADVDAYLEAIREVVVRGDFTLGAAVAEFEQCFAALCQVPYAIGVNSGTDALFLSLKALDIGPGDEVITVPNTFIATVGAIVMTGARPVFVDVNEQYTLDVNRLEGVLTPRTKAIVPVHLTGNPADMPAIMAFARRHGLYVVEDAAQAIFAAIDGQPVGGWGDAGCFSLHPLKNLNVWGDGGVIVTRSAELAERLRLLRNHGLVTRDEARCFGYNSRLDTIQAVVANRLLPQVPALTAQRIAHAQRLDAALAELAPLITIPPRRPNVRQVFHTYVVQAAQRDRLLAYLRQQGIEAKVHYPIPLHLQAAAAHLGYRRGDFPVCEAQCQRIITLPVHQHLSAAELEYMVHHVHRFYRRHATAQCA